MGTRPAAFREGHSAAARLDGVGVDGVGAGGTSMANFLSWARDICRTPPGVATEKWWLAVQKLKQVHLLFRRSRYVAVLKWSSPTCYPSGVWKLHPLELPVNWLNSGGCNLSTTEGYQVGEGLDGTRKDFKEIVGKLFYFSCPDTPKGKKLAFWGYFLTDISTEPQTLDQDGPFI